MSDIYQKIWDADQRENGIQAIFSNSPKDYDRGFVVVEEVKRGDDDHILFPQIHLPEKNKKPISFVENFSITMSSIKRKQNEKPSKIKKKFSVYLKRLSIPKLCALHVNT